MNRSHTLTLLATATLAATSLAQQLATYDPAAKPAQEFAAVACPPLLSSGYTADIVSFGPAPNWWQGAIAAHNRSQKLYYTTGRVADGLQRIAFADIGFSVMPLSFACPAGFDQVTGMAVDPRFSSGDVLFVTDGFTIANYDVATATTLAMVPAPVLGGHPIVGLAIDKFHGALVTVDETSTMRARSLAGGAWSPPIAPMVAVPTHPTGIAFCQTAPGKPFVSYWNGAVIDPLSGAVLTFPGAPSGIRHHRGMTFLGKAVDLGGHGGPPTWIPDLEIPYEFESGSPNTEVHLDTEALTVLAVDLAALVPLPLPTGPIVSGTMWVDPATSVLLGYGPGAHVLPLSLVGVPPGIGLTFQAAAWNGAGATLSDALHLTTHL